MWTKKEKIKANSRNKKARLKAESFTSIETKELKNP